MTDNQYKVELGVKLNTSDLKTEIDKIDGKHKIKLGVDLNVNDIRERINQYNTNGNNIKVKLKATLDTNDLKKQIGKLNLNVGGGKGIAIPINTESLESSFKDVALTIKDIRTSIGSLDSNSGMKSLLSSINQISNAIEKASNQFESLNANLTALSGKDLNLNFGINLGGSNQISRNAAYGNKARGETLPELQKQVTALEGYLQQYYEVADGFVAAQKLVQGTGAATSGRTLLDIVPKMLDTSGSLSSQMSAYKEYIALIKDAASLKNINLDHITSQFSKSADQLVQDAVDVQTGAKEMDESFEKLKQVFGGGNNLNIDGISQQLDSIVNDLSEIKTSLQSLSSGVSLEGLTQSFDKLSDTIEKLVQNAIQVKSVLGDKLNTTISDGGINKTVQDQKEIIQSSTQAANTIVQNEERKQQAYQETDGVIENLKSTLQTMKLDRSSIDAVIKDVQELGFEVTDASVKMKNGNFDITVKGIDSIGRAVTEIRHLDSATDEISGISRTISQSLKETDAFVKQQKQAVSNLTNQINQLNRAASDQNISRPIKDSEHLDSLSSKYKEIISAIQKMGSASSDTFVDAQNDVKRLISEYKSLVSELRNAENVSTKMKGTDFTSGLDIAKNDLEKFKAEAKDFPQITQTIENLDKAIEGVGDASSLNKFNDQLRVARSELAKIKSETSAFNRSEKVGINVSGLESKIADLQRISPEIDKFEAEIDGAKVSVQSLLNDLKQVNTQGDFSVVNSKFKAFADAAKAAGIALTEVVTKVKSVKDIKLDIELGAYDNQISQMDDGFNRLSSASTELRESVEQVHRAYAQMELVLEGTGDEVADKKRLIQAEQEYARALEKTNNLIRIQAREDRINIDNQKLIDDRQVFQSKIDSWLTKNSAATKKFGAAMLDLKAKAENCDRVDLNHLEKEFKQLDYAADKAGLKMQSTLDRIKGKFKEYMAYFSVAEVFMYVEQGLREMFNTVKEIDTAMTGLYRVTDLTAAQYDSLFNNMISSAKEYGATLNDIINATTDWVRAGFEADTALGLAEITTMYQHISDLDYDTAAENLITAYNGFKNELLGLYDGDEVAAVEYIADIFNELDNNFAVTSAGLGEAMTRSASALDLAGNSIQETAGLITGITEVTQDPEKAGSALKVLSLRLRGMKGQLEELGEETDENVENISKMQGQILNMTSGKVNIFDATGNFKSTYEIMKGIAEVWDDLSSIDQADLLETIAGKHRANDVAALLSNWENVEAAVKSASEAEGSAARENAKYVDSIQGRLDKLTTAWQSFANTFMESDFLKGAISGLTKFVELIEELVDSLGTVGTIGLGAGIFGLFKNKGLFTGILGQLGTFVSLVPDAIKSSGTLGGKFKNLGSLAGQAGGSIASKFTGSLSGMIGGIGLAIAAIGLIVNAYKNYREEISRTRQETIQASDEFLDAAGSFEQAYIKYSGRTDLTAEEESELESAIKGTVDALGNKSSALQNAVNSSNDYVASLEAITKAELKAAKDAAVNKRNNAELELKDATTGLFGLTSVVDIPILGKTLSVAEDVGSDFIETKGNRFSRTPWFELSSDADTEEIIDYYYTIVKYRDRLNELAETQPDILEHTTYSQVTKFIEKMSEAVKVYESGVYDAAKAQYQLANGIPKTTDAYLKMREYILNEVGGTIDTRKAIASGLDTEYGQAFDLTTAEVQARKLVGVLDEYGDNEVTQMETFLNIRTAVNNNECTVGDYMSQFDDINKMTEGWSDEAKGELNASFGLDTDTIKHQYDEVVKSYMRTFDAASGNLSGIQENFEKNFLDGLSASELSAVYNLKAELDWENDSWDNILKQIEEEAKLIEAISFSINLELETEKLENLSTAISESVSGAGLGTESISLVEDMFGDLDSYDQSKLFERTANGIRLNSDELRKLNDEYKKTNVDGLNDKVDALGERYFQTREELSDLTYGTDEYNQKARELSDIEAQINATEKLAAQYQGLASAYNEWQRAESSGSQRDMYESMIEGFENVGDEISRGWIDDGTIEFLELIKGEKATIIDANGVAKEIDIATASAKELKQVWKDLDKNIEHTSYSVRDFFTVDEDGNSTSQGVYNFLDAIGQMEEEEFGGKDVVRRNDKGNIIGFDFQIAGGDKAIAEALGISEELVQIMKRAADDAGFVVSMDGTYQQLDVLKKKAAEAAKKLKEEFKSTEYSFFQDGSEKGIKKDYDEALKVWETFKKNKNEDGTVNMNVKGAEEAYTLVSTLQSMVDQLSEPVYMELNVSQVEKDMQTPLSKLQEYETLVQTEHQLQLKGTDTTEIDNAQKEIIDYFENLNPEIKAKLGIKDLSREEIQKKVEAGEIEIPATIDLQVEMNNTLRDMVNVALYNAGLIDKDELEARVDIKLYADKIDNSDVEEKTEDAVEGEDGKVEKVEKEVEVDLITKRANELELTDLIKDYDVLKQKVIVEYFVEHSEVDKYTPEQKEALVEFIANSDNLDSYTPEQKQAIVEYLTDSADPDNWTPEQKEAVAKFIRESGDVDSYTPAQKEAIAKFIRDSIDPDTYDPPNPEGTVTFYKNTSDVDGYDPPNFTRYVTYYAKKAFSTGAKAGEKALENRFGIVNGTANFDGSAFINGTGKAFKQGDWRTKRSETALTGELGREIVVTPQNRWYTVGDNGAEFVNIPKGSIVFNHRQTEELLKNGKVTSDGGRARALVNGTAYLGGTAHRGEAQDGMLLPDDNSSSDKFEETFDWLETLLSRLERTIDNLDKTVNNSYKSWSDRNTALTDEISEVGKLIVNQNSAYDIYMAEAKKVGLDESWASKVRDGGINIEDETTINESTAKKIKEYQEWYEKALKCQDAIEDLKQTEAKLYEQRFENIQSQYDGILQGFEHTESMLNEYISQAEAKGHIVSKNYYQALIDNEKNNIAELKKEQADLIAARDKAVDSGKIIKGSQAWYNMCAEIDGVTQAIEEGSTALIEYNNAIRDIDWQVFDLIQERISDVTAEANFLIDLMSYDKLFDDNGKLTDKGMATMGLHGQNYNTYMYAADEYANQIAKLDKQIASDPYDQELINRRRELVELQRESILAAEDEKQAIKDLVEEGINLELDALQERIDLHNEELESMKDLYDYQKNVQEQTENIASLQKQLHAYEGFTDEETRATVQKLKLELEKANADLEETQYDKYIADQSALLDELFLEYENILNTRLDDTNGLITQVIDAVNIAAGAEGTIATALGAEGAIAKELVANGVTVKTTLENEAKNVGTTLSTAMKGIWSVDEGNAKSVITEYGKGFQDKQTTTNTVLGDIKAYINRMVDDVDKDATTKVNANKTTTSAKKDPTKTTATTTKTNTATNKSTGDGKPKIGDKVKFLSGKYYYDSQGVTPAGSKNHGKQVYITNINKKSWATHPYHISTGKKLGSGDLGWLKLNQLSGYVTGKKNFLNDEIAWTQENGQEFIVRPSDGAILTPIAKGDSVLTSAASSNIWDMANSPAEFIKDNLNLGNANVPNNSTVQNSYVQNFKNITFSMPNVHSYSELLREMQRDPKFEKLILSMTIDQIAGKSSLTKGKSIR